MSEPDQAETIAFLSDPATYGPGVRKVERIETHGAFVFLAGDDVYKMKRAVAFPYMDFSTLERRRRACAREVEIDKPGAPDIYLGLMAITRAGDGQFAFDGDGPAVEYAVHMRRFDGDALLSRVAERDGMNPSLARDLADTVFDYHGQAAVTVSPPVNGGGLGRQGSQILASIIDEVAGELADPAMQMDRAAVDDFERRCRSRLEAITALLDRRAATGKIRRCHGDLHLANIVLWQGKPTLFDAIEFDEALATIDVLYDLAFLLMDLEKHGQQQAANLVLNRYLWRSQDLLDIEGLAALPLFLGLRAAIRAMVGAQRAARQSGEQGETGRKTANGYLKAALAFLGPPAPRLVAVGGVSGTGKSTLAASMAPSMLPSPGAFHLRSDLERKAMFGTGETDRLPPETYTPEASGRVYALLLSKAETALRAGHSVVLDAAHLKPEEKLRTEEVARICNVPFHGIWLSAAPELLRARVAARTGDASDATVAVLDQQLGWAPGADGWTVLDAGSAPETLVSLASARLSRPVASAP